MKSEKLLLRESWLKELDRWKRIQDNMPDIKPIKAVAQARTSGVKYMRYYVNDQYQGLYLTQREKQVAELLITEFKAKRIARELKISSRTIEDYLARLKFKFNCRCKKDLVVILRKVKLVDVCGNNF